MGEQRSVSIVPLILGDLLGILLITLVGFASHGEISSVGRMLSTFVPVCIGWGLAASLLGLYQPDISADLYNLWRPAFAALLGIPLATWLRGVWLDAPILPIFVLVMIVTTALVMTLWRGTWMLLHRRKVRYG